jgi:platelet-activating factor acetylhydrolase
MFFVQKSQHFNQSDFGVLFPVIAKRFTKAVEPEQILELNNRAIVQMLREAGIEVAGESDEDILKTESGIPRWISIPVEDEDEIQATNTGALAAVDRKLSVGSIKGNAAPKDSMTMGQRTRAQLEM